MICPEDENTSAMDNRFDDTTDGNGGESSDVKKGLRAALLIK
jgi:hypothetical protein